MNKAIKIFNRFEDVVLVTMFSVMVGVIFMQIIMRFVFDNSLVWSEEFGKFLFVWLSWIGISIGARRGEHIKITMLTDRLPFALAQSVNIISELLLIGICVITAVYGVTLVFSQSGLHYAGIKISMSWGYLAVVIGCTLMTIRGLIGLITSVIALRKGAPEQIEGGEA